MKEFGAPDTKPPAALENRRKTCAPTAGRLVRILARHLRPAVDYSKADRPAQRSPVLRHFSTSCLFAWPGTECRGRSGIVFTGLFRLAFPPSDSTLLNRDLGPSLAPTLSVVAQACPRLDEQTS